MLRLATDGRKISDVVISIAPSNKNINGALCVTEGKKAHYAMRTHIRKIYICTATTHTRLSHAIRIGKYKKYIPAVGQQKEGTRLSEKMIMDGGLLEAAIGLGGQLSRWLKPTDFLPGTVVTFEMPSSGSKLFTLEILGHDEYTRKLLEDKARTELLNAPPPPKVCNSRKVNPSGSV